MAKQNTRPWGGCSLEPIESCESLLLAGLALRVGEVLGHGRGRGSGDQGNGEKDLFHLRVSLRLLAVRPELFGPKGVQAI